MTSEAEYFNLTSQVMRTDKNVNVYRCEQDRARGSAGFFDYYCIHTKHLRPIWIEVKTYKGKNNCIDVMISQIQFILAHNKKFRECMYIFAYDSYNVEVIPVYILLKILESSNKSRYEQQESSIKFFGAKGVSYPIDDPAILEVFDKSK